jgi:hypothetical protein
MNIKLSFDWKPLKLFGGMKYLPQNQTIVPTKQIIFHCVGIIGNLSTCQGVNQSFINDFGEAATLVKDRNGSEW